MMDQPNLSAEVVLPFGDGDHLFALKGKQIEHLQKACNAGFAEIAMRVMALQPRYEDLYHVILLGLEGGGMAPTEAKAFMDRYFYGRPIAAQNDPHSPLTTAAKVVEAAWFGVEDIASGEARAGESPAKSTSASSGPHSSDQA
jgi:hypothetical protein